ncbi:MAG: hypothetical protein U9R74_04680 [Pseudomonadota bacterium]|nr:hypothetical protein [Pseudomonadota bacterium]
MTIDRKALRHSLRKTADAFLRLLPLLVGVLLLAGLLVQLVPWLFRAGLFGHGTAVDTWVAAVIGSVSTGPPFTGYVLGGELVLGGIALVTVTAFITAWTTVGVVQLPAEAGMLGWRFALWRNLIAFLFCVPIAWLTVVTLRV